MYRQKRLQVANFSTNWIAQGSQHHASFKELNNTARILCKAFTCRWDPNPEGRCEEIPKSLLQEEYLGDQLMAQKKEKRWLMDMSPYGNCMTDKHRPIKLSYKKKIELRSDWRQALIWLNIENMRDHN